MRRILVWSVIGIFLLSLAGIATIGWVGSERALHPGYHSYKWNLATFPDLHPEHIQVRTSDKVLLDGRFFHGDRQSLVVLASGYGDTQDQMLSIAEFLHHAGFSVLTYNSRASSIGSDSSVRYTHRNERQLDVEAGYIPFYLVIVPGFQQRGLR